MTRLSIPKTVLLCLGFILVTNTTALGCWCRSPSPVLDQFEASKIVLLGRLASVSESKAGIVAERVFKGRVKVGDNLEFEQGQFADCLRGFTEEEIGERYLLYLSKPKDESLFAVSTCNRSNKVDNAFADLAYLDRMHEAAGKSRLYGYFTTSEAVALDFANLNIKITAKKTARSYSVKTDANGFFEIYDLAPGEYLIEPQMPAGWIMDVKYMFGIDDVYRKLSAYIVTVKTKRHTETRIRILRTSFVSVLGQPCLAP